jgi:CopG family transcriptional regulator, nickel-responsive regulator
MTRDEEITRIGISLPDTLVGEFDGILKCRGYTSRSEGIRDAMRIYNLNHQWLTNGAENRYGAITLVYDYRKENLLTALSALRMTHRNLIVVSVRSDLDKHRSVEVFIIRGTGAQLRELSDIMTTFKGIESVRITTTTLKPEPQELQPVTVLDDKRLPAESL